ncbi:MAG: PKD domain-containing protein, partial [Flavobacteriales bacterium]|nr:PKD domain-containing protein [Flavobacteriales bacterium]
GFKSYVFDYGDGTPLDSSSQYNRSHLYPSVGTYVVRVRIYNHCMRDTLVTDTVRVKPVLGFPNLTLNLSPAILCPGERTYVYVGNGGNYKGYVWLWGDGKKDSTQWNGLEHIYKSVGNYPLRVVVFNHCGQTDTLSDTIRVVPDAGFTQGAQLSGPNKTVCPGASISLNASCCYQTYVWDFGDGSPKDSLSSNQGAYRNHIFTSPGSYTVKVRIYNHCGQDTLLQYVQMVDSDQGFSYDPYFKLDFYPIGSKCPGEKVQFNAPSGYQSYVWDFGDGSPVDSTFDYYRNHKFNAVGTYNVAVRVYNHCGKDTLINATVSVNNSVGFPTDPSQFRMYVYDELSCPGERIDFNVPYGYQSYLWDFGDGQVDSAMTSYRDHSYDTVGTYDVKVTITNFCGLDTVLTETVTISDDVGFPQGDPNFKMDVYDAISCPGEEVTICNPYGYRAYVYDFGDGSPQDSTDRSCRDHRYDAPGVYPVTVTIYNHCGVDTTIQGLATIDSTLDFTGDLNIWVDPQRSCPGHEIRMDAPYGYQSYTWTFGDGDTAFGGANANHSYDSVGYYVVSVNMTNYCGKDTTISTFLNVDTTAQFPNYINVWAWPENNCPGDLVSLQTYQGFNAYYWDFGDGTVDTTTTHRIDHRYAALGTYTVGVTILNGCGNTITRYVTVNVVDNALVGEVDITILPNPACPGDIVQFVPNSDDGEGYTYWWDFGDGKSDTTVSAGTDHAYPAVGTYVVTITAVNGCGRKATIKRNVVINNGAVPTLDGETFGVVAQSQYAGCAGDAIVFYFYGNYPGNSWDFGDGSVAVATEQLVVGNGAIVTIVKHAYQSKGNFWAKLTITNKCGNSVTDSVLVKIGGNLLVDGDLFIQPAAGNQGYTTCTPVTFIGFGGSKFFWNFGDGDTVTTISPTVEHTYLNPGNYAVNLLITNACGNSQTVTGAVNVSGVGGPSVSVTMLSSVTCYGGSDGVALATPTTGQAPFTFMWDDALSQTTDTATGLSAGTYEVTVTDMNGCGTVKTVSVTQTPSISVSANKVDASCGGADGSASVNASNGVAPYTYLWSNGATNAIITNLAKGAYFVTATDANGCSQVGSVNVNETGAPVLSPDTVTDASCFGLADGSVFVGVTGGTAPFAFVWSTGATTQKAENLAAGNYLVTVTDAGGCGSVINVGVTQPGEIKLTASTVKSNCGTASGSASISASGGAAPYTYAWSSGGTGTTESPLPAGTYTVSVTDASGCVKSKEVTIENTGSPVISNVITNTSCYGTTDGAIDITVTGGTTPYIYTWSTGTNGQDVNNLAPGLYTLILQDGANCLSVRNYTITEPDSVTATIDVVPTACTQNAGSASAAASGGTQPYSYVWSTGETTPTITGLTPGNYQLTVVDANGCIGMEGCTILTSTPTPEICVVTVDSVLEKNVVVWEKTDGLGIASFNVYKEGTIQGQFNLIGNVPYYDVYSEFLDSTSDPRAVAARYRITAVDSCSNESDPGTIHKTMFLGTSPGLGEEIVLDWDPYEGMFVPSYNIWRGTNLAPMTLLTTVAGSITGYNDFTSNVGVDTVYYVVEVVHATGCTPTQKTKNYNSSRSNKSSIVPPPPGGLGGLDRSLGKVVLFPNPNGGTFAFVMDVAKRQNVEVRLMNMHGQLVWSEALGNVVGEVSRMVDLDRKVPGVYFFQVIAEGAVVTRKVVIE